MKEASASSGQVVSCPNCGAKNRLAPENRAGRAPVCGRCQTPLLGEAGPVIVTDGSFAEEVERSPLPVLLDLWAPWCGPCRVVGPIIDELAKEMRGRARVGKLNVDENPVVSSRFHVQSIPTLLIFKNGAEVDRLLGAYPKETIRQRLQRHL